MSTTQIDEVHREEFASRALQIFNDGMLALLISLGHQLRLFDTMAGLEPATCEQIAQSAELDGRYVREWLGGMTVGGIIEYQSDAKTYELPREHAACLTRAAGADNIASLAQYTALFGELEQQVLECFRHGGGVPYSAMPRFQTLQAEESAQLHDAFLIDVTLPQIGNLVDRLRSGIAVLDVGCGHGHAANLIANAYPASRVTGIDISEQGIAAARTAAAGLRLDNVTFEVRDGGSVEPGSYDLVTAFDVVHDLPQPAETLAAIRVALNPGGVFLMVDIAASSHLHENLEHPLAPALYTSSIFHCMTVSLAQGGAGLGAMWGEQQALHLLAGAGFAEPQIKRVEGDFLNAYYIGHR
jgi:2-polyprenyl-3-methyl-5-hydroxy-6-metoxy-1,4-benzoquinol methylase